MPDVGLAHLNTDIQILSAAPHPTGSAGELNAAEYLQKRFMDMGYTVDTQTCANEAGVPVTNLIAVKPATGDDADILVISAHHDSVPSSYGASDNASGVAALLAVAEELQEVPSDTEIRFISFSDEENGKNGSRNYMELLSEEERNRMIGDIQLDMLGGLGSDGQ